MRSFALVSMTCSLRRCPLALITVTVLLFECTSIPIYRSMGVLLGVGFSRPAHHGRAPACLRTSHLPVALQPAAITFQRRCCGPRARAVVGVAGPPRCHLTHVPG